MRLLPLFISSKLFLVFTALITLGSIQAENAPRDIVVDGKARAEIVLGDKPVRMSRFAAQELQTYLEKISGAKLPIVAQPSEGVPVQIYVGESQYTDKLGLTTEKLEHGAYRIASGPNWLALVGRNKEFIPIEPWGRNRSREETARVNAEFDKITGDTFWNNFREVYMRQHEDLGIWEYDDLGTVNAVYDYLRQLGVRWFAPGEIGEVVPSLKTLALPEPSSKVIEPDFPVRRISYFNDHISRPELTLWNMRLGINHAPELLGITQLGHGMKFVLMRDEMKANHPEIYAVWDGKIATDHKGGQGAPSLTSPVLKEKHLKYTRAVFDHFKEPMISLDVVDGFSGRIPDNDRHLATPERGWSGSMSDYLWGYINDVAKELYASHPDRWVSGLSYGGYSLPPEKIKTMSPNLVVIQCRNRSRFENASVREKDREVREAWLEKLPSKKILTWDYYLSADPARNPGRPAYFTQIIADDLKELKGVSLGDSIEVYDHRPDKRAEYGYDEFATNHLNIYVTSRLWWDADQDLNAILEDYCQKYYGPAAQEMRAFIDFSEANWNTMSRNADSIGEAFRLINAASQKVAPDSIYAQRIQRIVDYMEPLKAVQADLLAGRPDVPEAPIPTRPVKDLVLNGKMEGPFWENVPSYELKEIKTGDKVQEATQFKWVYGSDGNLYLGIRCQESDMANLNSPTDKDGDSAIWSGDFVELLIETPEHAYYQICIGPKGNVMDIDRSSGLNDAWQSGVEVVSHRGSDEWSVVLRIPPAGATAVEIDALMGISGDKPTKEDPWYINICRMRSRNGVHEASAWSPTGGTFHKPVPKAQKVFGRLFVD